MVLHESDIEVTGQILKEADRLMAVIKGAPFSHNEYCLARASLQILEVIGKKDYSKD